ncbi:hypothetical protein AB0F15_21540 [Amycolatopsis sp. NPDC026612]|uniref:hypothetical protein n=1 Tax=Amycolatopsis sp. NPDC026612 TaxID=3155466 RepID=UPI0033F1F81B
MSRTDIRNRERRDPDVWDTKKKVQSLAAAETTSASNSTETRYEPAVLDPQDGVITPEIQP